MTLLENQTAILLNNSEGKPTIIGQNAGLFIRIYGKVVEYSREEVKEIWNLTDDEMDLIKMTV